MSAYSGNRSGQNSAPWTDPREQQQVGTGPSQEHIPVRGFNSAELKAALRRGRHYRPFRLYNLLTLFGVSLGPGGNTRPSSQTHVRHEQKSR
jgi:hypothetical protein